MKAIISFIKASLTKDSPESSKRLFGSIGFISAIVMITIWQHDLISELLFTSAGLIGLGILDKTRK